MIVLLRRLCSTVFACCIYKRVGHTMIYAISTCKTLSLPVPSWQVNHHRTSVIFKSELLVLCGCYQFSSTYQTVCTLIRK